MKVIILLLLFPVNVYSQKIKTEIDKFTNEKRIETGWSSIRPTLSAPLSIKIRSVGKESVFITLAGANYGANVIGNDATAMFLLDDKTTITITSTGIQDYEIGEYGKSYQHQYRITVSDLKLLSVHIITSIRKSDSETYHDFDIEKKNGEKFRQLVIKFLKEFNNQ